MASVKIEGKDVKPATVEGSHDVFTSKKFVLTKARWIDDSAASVCILCNNKFSQIRRKHHCRVCGHVLCAKCCKDKVPLPQLGIMEPEKVCEGCKPVTELVTMSQSHLQAFQADAAAGLSQQVLTPHGLQKFIELGGMQALVCLAINPDARARGSILHAMHTLSTHPTLHTYIADAGAIRAVCSLLNDTVGLTEEQVIHGVSTLMVFCKTPQLQSKALSEGVLGPIMGLLSRGSSAVALLALRTLTLALDSPSSPLTERELVTLLPRLCSLTGSEDEQLQELSLSTLVTLSLSGDPIRHRIVQDDFTCGRNILRVLTSSPRSAQVTSNAACLAANLATSAQDQVSLQDVLDALCALMPRFTRNANVLCHVARAVANFARFPQNSARLLTHVPTLVNTCLKNSTVTLPAVRHQATRGLLAMLHHSSEMTIDSLMREGASEFLRSLGAMPSVMGAANSAMLTLAPDIGKLM